MRAIRALAMVIAVGPLLSFSAFAGDIWLHMLTSGTPIGGTYHLGDTVGGGGGWQLQFEIGQASWNASEAGIGPDTTDNGDWNWGTASWYANGDSNNKKVQRDIGAVLFTSTGSWYVNGRAKADPGDSYHYANNTDWGNSSTFSPAYYFTVNALNTPSGASATDASETQIDLAWTKGTSGTAKDTVIFRYSSSTPPTLTGGNTYTVGNDYNGYLCVYNGSDTSHNDTGLTSGTTYHYFFFSKNNNYYSASVTANDATPTTTSSTTTSSTSSTTSTTTSTTTSSTTSVDGADLLAQDMGANYGSWTGNGGFGFDAWVFQNAGNAAGFLADGTAGLNYIATSAKAWGTYANGGGYQGMAAFRGLSSNDLSEANEKLKISMENGAVQNGGTCGIVLRNGNATTDADSYDDNQRLQFYFLGGDANYKLIDSSGTVDTGVPYTANGVRLIFKMTGANTYKLDIYQANGGAQSASLTGTLAGSGGIESVALFNRDVESADVFFNALEVYGTTTTTSTSTTSTSSTSTTSTTSTTGEPTMSVGPGMLTYATMLGSAPASQTFGVTNVGEDVLAYTNTVAYGVGASGWLTITPSTGALATAAHAIHTAAVSVVGSVGTYWATNTLSGNQVNGSKTVAVSLTVSNVPTPQSVSVTSIGTRNLTLGWTLDGYQALIVRREGGANPDAPANGTAYNPGDTYGPDNRNTVVTSASAPSYSDTSVLPQTAYSYGLFGINNSYYSPGAYASATTLTAQVDGNANEWIATAGTVVNASTISGREFIWRDKDGEQRNDAGEPVAGNNDIQEFRVRADANNVYFYVKLREITDTTYPYIAIGVDTDRNPNDANGMDWVADDSGTTLGYGYYTNTNARMHHSERNVIVHHVNGIGHRIELHADDGFEWYGPPTNGNTAVRFNDTDNFIEFRLTRTDLGLTGSITGRLSVAAYFNNTTLGANVWANNDDTTADYSVNDALDSLTVLRYGVDDAAGTRGAYGEDLDDGDLDTFMDLKFDAAGLVDNVLPPAPVAVYPPDGGTVEPGAFTFQWGAVTDSDDALTSYFFELSDNATFNGGENFGITRRGNTMHTEPAYVMEPAQTPATYYWRVRSRDLTGALSGAATRSYTIAGADDDIEGPQPSLVFVGPGYTNGAYSLSLTDADMLNSGDLVDIAVAWTDPSGVFMTNSPPHASINIFDLSGRVIPNWDLFKSNTITTVTNSFGYDLPFTDFIGRNGGISVTTVYHNAFSVSQINTNEFLYLTVSAEDEDNDRGTKPDPQGDGDAVPFDRTVITNVLVRFTVVDDDTNGPVYTSVNVSGEVFTNVYLSAGLTVTGLVQDAKSGVYGGSSNRYELYWFNQLVESGSFSTRPATDGAALAAPEAVGVALSPLSVTITGQYSLVCFATDFDHEHLADWAIGSRTFQFQVVQPPLPPGTKGTYFVIDNDWSGAATLPFVESFDGLSTGALHGQNGWNATDADIAVQTANAYSGRAVALVDGYGFHGVNAAGATDVWMDWYAKPQPKPAAPVYIRDVALKSTAAFYLNPSGYVVAMSNTTWLTYTHVVLATNAWVRFSVNLDYAADTWSLYAADSTPNALVTNVFRDVPFHTNVAATALSLRMVEDGATARAMWMPCRSERPCR